MVLVEESPQLRTGGYVIDFGFVGYDIAEKMGLIPRLRELGYHVTEMRFVDREGRTRASMSVDALARLTHGRYITLRRSDLAATIYGALDGTVETIATSTSCMLECDGEVLGRHGCRHWFNRSSSQGLVQVFKKTYQVDGRTKPVLDRRRSVSSDPQSDTAQRNRRGESIVVIGPIAGIQRNHWLSNGFQDQAKGHALVPADSRRDFPCQRTFDAAQTT